MSTAIKAEDIDTDFLPYIYDVIRSIEKDVHDSTQKAKDSQETYQKMLDLKSKLQNCREQIEKLPGIEYSPEEQLVHLDALRKQLILKKELLFKYRNMCHFDVPARQS